MIRVLVLVCLLALFLAYLVAPVAQRVQRWFAFGRRRPLPRWLAILVVYVIGALVVSAVWRAVGPRWEFQVDQLQVALPMYADHALDRVLSIESRFDSVPVAGEAGSVAAWLTLQLSLFVKSHVRETIEEVRESLPHVRWLWLVPVLSLVLLQVSPTFRRTTIRALPPGQLQWRIDELMGHVNWVLAGYTRAQVIAGVFVATATGAIFAVLKVPYALSLGLAAGVLELLPVVGPISIALSVALLTTGPTLVAALVALAALRIVQDYVVYPQLMGRRMHLPPLAVVLALLAGARVGGIVGVALALPAVGVGAVAWRHWRDHRDIERLVRAHAEERATREARAIAHAIAHASENVAEHDSTGGGTGTRDDPSRWP